MITAAVICLGISQVLLAILVINRGRKRPLRYIVKDAEVVSWSISAYPEGPTRVEIHLEADDRQALIRMAKTRRI